VVFPSDLTVIVIDHHATNTKFGSINLIKKDKSSTSEIIFNLLFKNKITINPSVAACLLGGIYTDSGGFKYSSTNFETFQAAAYLAKIYPKFNELIFEIENNDHPQRLEVKSIYLKQIQYDHHLAISFMKYNQYKKYFSEEDASINGEIANNLKSVIGWDIAICLTEVSKNQTKASFRTRDTIRYPVGPLALATGFGGGHNGAAGASFPFSLTKTINLLKTTINKIYPDILK
jgi:phosphoesterase RecJ-like protein